MNIISKLLYNFLNLLPLKHDEEYFSYDDESLLTNILLKETIDCILEQIHVLNRLPIICSKLILPRKLPLKINVS